MTWPDAVRKLVQSRACDRCEYCLLALSDAGLPHEIDHVISRKHGGASDPENLAFACYLATATKGVTLPPCTLGLVSLCAYTTRAKIAGETIFASQAQSSESVNARHVR